MRFSIHLAVSNHNGENRLPIDYQYIQSAVIYRILGAYDEEYATWLHNNGYQLESGKRFKLFCYSRFGFESYKTNPNDYTISFGGNSVKWTISFLPEKSTQEFVMGLFNGTEFTIGNRSHRVSFQVTSLENLPSPSFTETMEYTALSPVCIKQHINDHTLYLSPTDAHYSDGILKGLLSRYEAFHGKPFEGDISVFKFELLPGRVKSSLIDIKGIKVRGYTYSFRLTAPKELQQMAYEGGIGEECSQGFGYIDIIKSKIK